MQLFVAIVVVLLFERLTFKGAIKSTKEMLKDIPEVFGGLAIAFIAFIVLCFICMFISK